jgi:hypothetical protein
MFNVKPASPSLETSVTVTGVMPVVLPTDLHPHSKHIITYRRYLVLRHLVMTCLLLGKQQLVPLCMTLLPMVMSYLPLVM